MKNIVLKNGEMFRVDRSYGLYGFEYTDVFIRKASTDDIALFRVRKIIQKGK